MKRNAFKKTTIISIIMSVSAGVIWAQHHELPQYPEDSLSQKICYVIPPGWDESYGSIDPETGIPETEPNLTMYNWENGETLSLEHIMSSIQEHIPEEAQSGSEVEYIVPTVEQATEFVEKIEADEPEGYTIGDVFVPPGSYPAHTALWIEETETIIGALEDCTFEYVDVIPVPPTPTPSTIILRPLDDKIPESIQDRTERIAAIAIIGVLRGIHIGVTIAP